MVVYFNPATDSAEGSIQVKDASDATTITEKSTTKTTDVTVEDSNSEFTIDAEVYINGQAVTSSS